MMEGKKPEPTLQQQAEKTFSDMVKQILLDQPLSGAKKPKYLPGSEVLLFESGKETFTKAKVRKTTGGIYLLEYKDRQGGEAYSIATEGNLHIAN